MLADDEQTIKEIDSFVAGIIRHLDENPDTETAHAQADELLLRVLERHGYNETSKAFREMKKWYA